MVYIENIGIKFVNITTVYNLYIIVKKTLCNSRACFSDKCNVPDEIKSQDLSHWKSPLYQLKEISTNAVGRGGYEPPTVLMTLGRGAFPLHLF